MSRRDAREAEFVAFAGATALRLRRTAFLMCGDWHLAEDLVQTALAKVYVAWLRGGAPDEPTAYARTVLLRSLLDHRRRRSSAERPTADLPDATVDTPHDLRLSVVDALRTLKPADRAVLVLRYWEDLSVEQTALALGLRVPAVKSRHARALRRFEQAWGQPALA